MSSPAPSPHTPPPAAPSGAASWSRSDKLAVGALVIAALAVVPGVWSLATAPADPAKALESCRTDHPNSWEGRLEDTGQRREAGTCTWPAVGGADADGYSVVRTALISDDDDPRPVWQVEVPQGCLALKYTTFGTDNHDTVMVDAVPKTIPVVADQYINASTGNTDAAASLMYYSLDDAFADAGSMYFLMESHYQGLFQMSCVDSAWT